MLVRVGEKEEKGMEFWVVWEHEQGTEGGQVMNVSIFPGKEGHTWPGKKSECALTCCEEVDSVDTSLVPSQQIVQLSLCSFPTKPPKVSDSRPLGLPEEMKPTGYPGMRS